MKRFLVYILVFIILLIFAGVVFANTPIRVIVNGKVINPDVQPQLKNGRLMVPIRSIAEAMGARVEWRATDKTAIITNDNFHNTIIKAVTEFARLSQKEADGYEAITNNDFQQGSIIFSEMQQQAMQILIELSQTTPPKEDKVAQKLHVYAIKTANVISIASERQSIVTGGFEPKGQQEILSAFWDVKKSSYGGFLQLYEQYQETH